MLVVSTLPTPHTNALVFTPELQGIRGSLEVHVLEESFGLLLQGTFQDTGVQGVKSLHTAVVTVELRGGTADIC